MEEFFQKGPVWYEAPRGICSVEDGPGNIATIKLTKMKNLTASRVFFPASCAILQVSFSLRSLIFLLLQLKFPILNLYKAKSIIFYVNDSKIGLMATEEFFGD